MKLLYYCILLISTYLLVKASSEASELDDITSDVMQSLFLISGATFKELAKELRPLKNCEIGIYLEKIILNLKRKSDVILKEFERFSGMKE